MGAGVGSMDGRGSMAAYISCRSAQERVGAVMGGGGADNAKHSDGRTREVLGRRDGRVGEQTRCLLGRFTAQARKDSV